jgi:hypothetical protein
MMIASCKHFDGWALGFDKLGESSGEREGKFGNVLVPPQPTPKDKFASKPNQLLKPREKPSEKASEKPSEKPSGKSSEKPCEEPHPRLKPRSILFHCEFCGKDDHKREFCYKEGERREWLRSGQTRTGTTLLMVCLSLVCHCPRERVLCIRFQLGEERVPWEQGTLLEELNRPNWFGNRSDWFGGSKGTRLVFFPVMSLNSVQEVVVLVVGLESLQVASLLDVLHLVINTSLGEVAVLSPRGGTDHAFPFMVLILLQ